MSQLFIIKLWRLIKIYLRDDEEQYKSIIGEEPPYEDTEGMLLYIWVPIDLPYIEKRDLIYNLSFNLNVFTPFEAEKFVNEVIELGYLVKTEKGLSLNKKLEKEYEGWQKDRTKKVKERIEQARLERLQKLSEPKVKESTAFAVLLTNFADGRTIQRALSVDMSRIDLSIGENNEIIGTIKGSEIYTFVIDSNTKYVSHNCPDYLGRRMDINMFCKHLTRVVILLKKIDKDLTRTLLMDMTNNYDKWSFMGG